MAVFTYINRTFEDITELRVDREISINNSLVIDLLLSDWSRVPIFRIVFKFASGSILDELDQQWFFSRSNRELVTTRDLFKA